MPHKKHAARQWPPPIVLQAVQDTPALPWWGTRFGETKNEFDALGLDKASVTGRVGARIKRPHRDVLCATSRLLHTFHAPAVSVF